MKITEWKQYGKLIIESKGLFGEDFLYIDNQTTRNSKRCNDCNTISPIAYMTSEEISKQDFYDESGHNLAEEGYDIYERTWRCADCDDKNFSYILSLEPES